MYHYAGNNPVKYTGPDGNQMVVPAPIGIVPAPPPVMPFPYSESNGSKTLGDEFIPSNNLGNPGTVFPKLSSQKRLKITIFVALTFPLLILIANTSDIPSQGEIDGGVEGAPPVDAGKQGKHVPGHPNSVPEKSQWKKGTSGIPETQQGWNNDEVLPDGTRVWDSGKELGEKGETGVRVHQDKKGRIHGYPVEPKQYLGE